MCINLYKCLFVILPFLKFEQSVFNNHSLRQSTAYIREFSYMQIKYPRENVYV